MKNSPSVIDAGLAQAGRAGAEGAQLSRNVDMRLPRKGSSSSHGARPVHQIISMVKQILTSRLSIKKSL